MRWFILVLLSLCSISVFSQDSAVPCFNSTLHNFKILKEIDGKVYHDFTFINKGNVPVIIKKVKSTCGCMSPNWTKHPVLPGKRGFIRATFDPTNRPGNFDKTISVYTNAKNSVQVLRIRGKVIPKKKTVLDNYPYELPCGLRMIYDHISFRSIKENKSKQIEIPVYNNHGKKLDIKFLNMPDFLTVKIIPEVLEVKGKGKIVAKYNAKIRNDLGLLKDQIIFSANGHKQQMGVSVNVKQDFSSLTIEERKLAPVISIDKKYIKFGTLEKGKSIDYTIKISNTGNSDLLIKKLYSLNGCVNLSLSKKVLAPNESVDARITLNTKNLQGKQKMLIGLISNDPLNSEIKIRLSGIVN